MRVAGSVALVTGASSGIGRAVATRLARDGATVLAAGRDKDRLARLATDTGAVPVPVDLSSPHAPTDLAERALAVAGRVDIVVNNAGTGWAGPVTAMSAADVDTLLAVNLRAPLQLTRALLPDLGRPGHLVFVGSIAGGLGVRDEAVYAAVKAGLHVFAESLRLELARDRVGVSLVVPGVVDTAFFARRGRPYDRARPRPMPAERVASALVDAIRAGRDEVYLPRWLRLAVAVRGVAPGTYRRLAGRYG
ncbi:MAG TPA: SDR family NAD(P)-dependent oxidoreductase [Micromonosporaceae bacterium]